MNIYRTEFFAFCPSNNVRVKYDLKIETTQVIKVEEIIDAVTLLHKGFHEEIADQLHREFGGIQTIVAEHHGVTIETRRGDNRSMHLDQSVGGMAGTPGY